MKKVLFILSALICAKILFADNFQIMVIVSSNVDYEQKEAIVEVKIPFPKGVNPDNIQVFNNKDEKVPCQVETQYDNPETEEVETEIIWLANLDPHKKSLFKIVSQKEKSLFEIPDKSFNFDGKILTNSYYKIELSKNPQIWWEKISLCEKEEKIIPLTYGPSTGEIISSPWKIEEKESVFKVLEKGPIRYRFYWKGKGNIDEKHTFEFERWMNAYANHPEIKFYIKIHNIGSEPLDTGWNTYLFYLYPSPGGEMSTPVEKKGEDTISFLTDEGIKTKILKEISEKWKEGQYYEIINHSGWVDIYDTDTSNPSGLGLIFFNKEKGGLCLPFNLYYHKLFGYEGEKADTHWTKYRYYFGFVPFAFRKKIIPSCASIDLDVYLLIHKGDYKTTEKLWNYLKNPNTVVLEEIK